MSDGNKGEGGIPMRNGSPSPQTKRTPSYLDNSKDNMDTNSADQEMYTPLGFTGFAHVFSLSLSFVKYTKMVMNKK